MVYLDTSILLPLFIREPKSEVVRARLQALLKHNPTISEWTRTEFASAIGIMARSRRLEQDVAHDALRAFHAMADSSLAVLVPEKEDFLLASRFLERFELGLRAGDALHLAIAANHGAKEIYALDHIMIRSAQKLNIKAHMVVERVSS